ncbi:DUF4355 domain-containing protein [Levilactobacillus brevis]|uniref:DUF4355 domain-containing protein n=1 Tax=Levilactobacillus brevis TaxID=1580 RepID=UPI0021A721A1|nr:DUF4355 domain-containing protein [Levilactobacillus brevis]MCT3567643.1 DUF4355 domain-containing protein [Levilactobacillus brevis]
MKRLEADLPMKMNLQYFAEGNPSDENPDGQSNDSETNLKSDDDPDNGNDGDKNAEIIKKLTARIGKEQGQKNDVQAKLDKAQAELEKLRKGSEKPKPLTPEQEEVKQLKAQMARRDTVDETVKVFNESGVVVPKNIVEVLVTDDHDKTIDNATKLLGFITSIQKDTEDSVRKEYQAGKIPESTKHGKQSLSDLGKAVSQSTPSRQSLDNFE